MTEGMSLSQINRPTINMNNTEVGNSPNEKNSGEEYFDRRKQNQDNEEFTQSPFVDRSAQLRATLNSLAALNAANIVNAKGKYASKKSKLKQKPLPKVEPVEEKETQEQQEADKE